MTEDRFTLYQGDCLEVMRGMEANSVDSFVTDPPYGLSFMGKDWDHGVPGVAFWQEALRVAKPGAHLLAFGGTRTFHRLAVAIEDAGWEIRDTIMWVYGSGFPKSHDVSKAIDREAGMSREVIGPGINAAAKRRHAATHDQKGGVTYLSAPDGPTITAPATPEAVRWQGWGTALKPAWEPVIVARKPLAGTVAENVLTWGTGAMNIDGGRVGTDEVKSDEPYLYRGNNGNSMGKASERFRTNGGGTTSPAGRWPANLIHDGSDEVLAGFPMTGVSAGGGMKDLRKGRLFQGNTNPNITDRSGFGDTGSAARFFYCAKASKQDRDEGCDGLEAKAKSVHIRQSEGRQNAGKMESLPMRNHHPTVKPTALMRYLCRLVTPPDGVVLDPFMGSGSTGKAAMLEGFRFVGIDIEPEYIEIATARIKAASNGRLRL